MKQINYHYFGMGWEKRGGGGAIDKILLVFAMFCFFRTLVLIIILNIHVASIAGECEAIFYMANFAVF